jgi:hypothetical protein
MRLYCVEFRPGKPKEAIIATVSQKAGAEARGELKGYKIIRIGLMVVQITNLDEG